MNKCPYCNGELTPSRSYCTSCNKAFVHTSASATQNTSYTTHKASYDSYASTGILVLSSNFSEIKRKSKLDMDGNYGYSILTMILLTLVYIGSAIFGFIGTVLVGGAVQSSVTSFYLDIANRKMNCIDRSFNGFKKLGTALGANLLLTLLYLIPIVVLILVFVLSNNIVVWTVFTLLAILAIAVIEFLTQFTFFAIHDDCSASDSIKKSVQLVCSNFSEVFMLHLSFIGWWLLVGLTFGILGLYVIPYWNTACANMYIALTPED